jgi:hypothetical protein
MMTPTQSRRYGRMVRDFTPAEAKAYNDHLIAGKRAEDFFEKIEKHLAGQHDQSSHGSWASGKAKDITKELGAYFGKNVSEYLKSEGKKVADGMVVQAHVNETNVGNLALEIIAKKQGFDGKPRVVTSEEMDSLEQQGWTIAYRGVIDGESIAGDPISAEKIVDQFVNGDYYGGRGTSGDGYYFAADKEVADFYARGTTGTPNGKVIKVAIPPNSLMSNFDFSVAVSDHRWRIKDKITNFWLDDDLGVSLAAKGYRGAQGMRAMGLRNQPKESLVYVIWDRSMLAVEEIK